jgi:hypothetical protein
MFVAHVEGFCVLSRCALEKQLVRSFLLAVHSVRCPTSYSPVYKPIHKQSPGHLCVLGVDPAVAGATGYGVVQSDGRRCRMLRFGAWRPFAEFARDSAKNTSARSIR